MDQFMPEMARPLFKVKGTNSTLVTTEYETQNEWDSRTITARAAYYQPELLAALEMFVWLDDGDEPFAWKYADLFDQARIIITKTKGNIK